MYFGTESSWQVTVHDSQLLFSTSEQNTSGLPKTSAVPEGDSGFVPNTSYFSEE